MSNKVISAGSYHRLEDLQELWIKDQPTFRRYMFWYVVETIFGLKMWESLVNIPACKLELARAHRRLQNAIVLAESPSGRTFQTTLVSIEVVSSVKNGVISGTAIILFPTTETALFFTPRYAEASFQVGSVPQGGAQSETGFLSKIQYDSVSNSSHEAYVTIIPDPDEPRR